VNPKVMSKDESSEEDEEELTEEEKGEVAVNNAITIWLYLYF